MLRLSVKFFALLQFLALVEASSYFTSVKRLQKLINIDLESYSEIKQLSEKISNEILERKLAEWSDDIEKAQKDRVEYLKNPLNEFKLIKRSTVDLSFYEKFFPGFKMNFRYSPSLPTLSDLVGAVKGLTRLQKFYQLETEDFAKGIFGGVATGTNLTVDDMLAIADSLSGDANSNGRVENFLAIQYLNLAQSQQRMNDTTLCEMFVDVSTDVINIHLTEMEQQFEELSENERDSYTIMCEEYLTKVRPVSKKVNPLSELLIVADETGYTAEKEAILMQQTCRGKVMKTLEEQSKLFCRHHSTNPFTIIAPFKVEVVNVDPEILIFVDVISEKENSEILRIFSESKKTIDAKMDKMSVSNNIYSSSSVVDYFTDESHAVFRRLTRRLDDMTGLTMNSAEPIQLQSFGIGGHHDLHYDFIPKKLRGKKWKFGDPLRIASALFYLSDVDLGGGTAFPYLKLLIPPVKGSAVFWHNLRPNGNDDYHTRHGECPVLIGNKIVLNKWIHDTDQLFRRPCDLINEREQNENVMYRKNLPSAPKSSLHCASPRLLPFFGQ